MMRRRRGGRGGDGPCRDNEQTWKSIHRSCNHRHDCRRFHLPTRRWHPCTEEITEVFNRNAPSSPSLSHPLLKSQAGKSTGPFYRLPIVVGSPGRGENIHLESFYLTTLCCLLTLSKACDRARPSKVSDIRPSSILCKYLFIIVKTNLIPPIEQFIATPTPQRLLFA